ncbi:MAG: TerB family tellurite resistance protein [Candidatus Poseidoniaceae archaeon]|nr:TerB family tellurite resistance protein [Candidatus Poseidoniaceae archaeon]
MVDGFLGSLTTEERMLLHLHDHILPEGEWEAPLSLTQAGISAAVHVQRKHVPRTLKRLESRGCLVSSKRHIPGAKQRRTVYGLSSDGRKRASELRGKILSREVNKDDSTIMISELRKGGQLTLELLSHIDEAMVFHEVPVISPVSNPEGVASLDAQAGEQLVRRLFARAWADGKITKDEQQLLSEVVEFLGMHPERVRRLSDESRRDQKAPPPEEIYLDMLKQALVDGELIEDEIALLETVRVAFGIDQLTHQKLLKIAISDPELPQDIASYRATLETALADGIITADEDAMLQTLREVLNISQSLHAELLAELRDSIK